MLTMYKQVTIHTLHKQGIRQSEIAKQLECHRHTVVNILINNASFITLFLPLIFCFGAGSLLISSPNTFLLTNLVTSYMGSHLLIGYCPYFNCQNAIVSNYYEY